MFSRALRSTTLNVAVLMLLASTAAHAGVPSFLCSKAKTWQPGSKNSPNVPGIIDTQTDVHDADDSPVKPWPDYKTYNDPERNAYAFLKQTVEDALTADVFPPDLTDADAIAQICWGSAHGLVALQNVKGADSWIAWRDPRANARRLIDGQRPDAELQARLAAWSAARVAHPDDAAGYRKLYVEHVLQADEGCDFDFLVGCRGAPVPAHSH